MSKKIWFAIEIILAAMAVILSGISCVDAMLTGQVNLLFAVNAGVMVLIWFFAHMRISNIIDEKDNEE